MAWDYLTFLLSNAREEWFAFSINFFLFNSLSVSVCDDIIKLTMAHLTFTLSLPLKTCSSNRKINIHSYIRRTCLLLCGFYRFLVACKSKLFSPKDSKQEITSNRQFTFSWGFLNSNVCCTFRSLVNRFNEFPEEKFVYEGNENREMIFITKPRHKILLLAILLFCRQITNNISLNL